MSNPNHSTRWVNGVDTMKDTQGTCPKPERPLPDKLTLTNEQVDTLRVFLGLLRGNASADSLGRTVYGGDTMGNLTHFLNHVLGFFPYWEHAIYAMDSEEPKEFTEFFKRYQEASLGECRIACRSIPAPLLASFLAWKARRVTHWDYIGMYDSNKEHPFFIAGLECLIEAHML